MRSIREWMLRSPSLRRLLGVLDPAPPEATAPALVMDAVAAPVALPPAAANVVAFPDPFVRHRSSVQPMRIRVGPFGPVERARLDDTLRRAGHVPVGPGDPCDAGVDATLLDRGGRGGIVVVGTGDAREWPLQRPLDPRRVLDALAAVALQSALRAPPPIVTDEVVVDPRTLDDLAGLGVGEVFVSMFVRQCMDDAEGALRLFRVAAVESRWHAARDQLEALGGIAANLGLVRLQAAAAVLGRLSDERLARDWHAGLPALASTLAEGRAALRARGTPGVAGAEPA